MRPADWKPARASQSCLVKTFALVGSVILHLSHSCDRPGKGDAGSAQPKLPGRGAREGLRGPLRLRRHRRRSRQHGPPPSQSQAAGTLRGVWGTLRLLVRRARQPGWRALCHSSCGRARCDGRSPKGHRCAPLRWRRRRWAPCCRRSVQRGGRTAPEAQRVRNLSLRARGRAQLCEQRARP